jgi:CRP-like cAMP-binding protein
VSAPADIELLKQIPLFESLSPTEIESVAAAAQVVDVPAGQTLATEATPGRDVMVLLEGAAKVEHDGSTIASAEPGAVIGEIAVVTRMSRTATVTTTMPSRLLVIDANAFRSLMDTIPALGRGAWASTAAQLK